LRCILAWNHSASVIASDRALALLLAMTSPSDTNGSRATPY
jgi:hypothetical protein